MRKRQSPEMKRARSAWYVMRRRCLRPTFVDFPRYGGAGIRICPQWAIFEQFIADMGLPPSPEHWLGRLDVKGHYTRDNCVWTMPTPQKRRRSTCRIVRVAGVAMTAKEAGQILEIGGKAVIQRVGNGFNLDSPRLQRVAVNSTWVHFRGETLPIYAWADRLGFNRSTLEDRIKRSGWPIEKALTTPVFRPQPKRKPPHDAT